MNVKNLMNALRRGRVPCAFWAAVFWPGFAMAVETADHTADATGAGWFALLAPVVAVTLAMVAMLWWLRRGRSLRGGGRQGSLRVVQAVAVGSRERVVVLDAQNRRFLLGVTAHRVELLAELQAGEARGSDLARQWTKTSGPSSPET